MGGEQIVDEGADLIEIEFSGGVRIEHRENGVSPAPMNVIFLGALLISYVLD